MPAIAISSIVTPLRSLLRDEAGQTTNEWSDTELLGYITDGVLETTDELSLTGAGFNFTTVTFNMTAGLSYYTPASDLLKVVKLSRVDSPPDDDVPPTTWEAGIDLDQITGSAPPGRGTLRYIHAGDNIWIKPVPQSTIASAFRMLYEQKLVPDGGYTTTSTSLTLPDGWLRFTIYASACYALLQDEQNPGTVYQTKEMILKRLIKSYRNRTKGRARYMNYVPDRPVFGGY